MTNTTTEKATLNFHKLMTLKEAVDLFPPHIGIATLRAWIRRGVRGVKLECVRLGSRVFLHPEKLRQYIDALNKT